MKYTNKKYRAFRQYLGRNIILYRQEKGMSLEDLANLSSLTSPHINDLEEGRKSPHINSIFRICCALEIEPYMLLDTIYGEDDNGKRICLSNFSIEDNQLSKEEIHKIYDNMVTSGKYIPPDKR